MTPSEITSALEGATIARVNVVGDDTEGEIFAFQLTSGEIFMLQGGHNGEVGLERDDRPNIWFDTPLEKTTPSVPITIQIDGKSVVDALMAQLPFAADDYERRTKNKGETK